MSTCGVRVGQTILGSLIEGGVEKSYMVRMVGIQNTHSTSTQYVYLPLVNNEQPLKLLIPS